MTESNIGSALAYFVNNYTTLAGSLIAVIYFLPMLISMFRGHQSKGSIFIINLFLGWTIIAWIICLAWAVGEVRKPESELEDT